MTDQVLDDFMRRAVPPAPPPTENPDGKRQADALLQSEFARKVLCDGEGNPLVPEPELRAWAERLSTVLYGTGEYVFRQGDGGDCCFIVLEGAMSGRVRHGDSGKETTFNVGVGEVVGEMSLLTGRPRTADVRVERSAELLRIPAAGFAALLAGRPGLAEQLSRLVAERVQHNLRQVEQQMAEDAASGEPAVSSEGILRRFWRLLGGAPE